MILLNILDVKDMMSQLLLAESFDSYLFEEASVTTFARMELLGRRNREWYDLEEDKALPEFLYWKEAKPMIYAFIRGKRTPQSFSISFRVPEADTGRLLGEQLAKELVDGRGMKLLFRFQFEKGRLSLITGTSYQDFIMDKRGDFAWDSAIKELLQQMRISFEEG